MTALPPIAAVLDDGAERAKQHSEVPVQLAATLTEVGTLAVACVFTEDPNRRWQLEFQLRGRSAGHIVTGGKPHPRLDAAAERIERIYGGRSRTVEPREVKLLRADLEKLLGKRDAWDTALLRELFAVLLEGSRRRRRSPDHERLWFNLAGFCLRPGFGYPLDDWRVEQLWALYDQGVQYLREAQVWSEWWTLWRRVAGGLGASVQERLLDDIATDLQPIAGKKKRTGAPHKQGYDDMVRLVASLERLPRERKAQVGSWLLERLQGKGESPQTWWAIGRLGARVPFHGSVHNVVAREVAAEWLPRVLALDWKKVQPAGFAAATLARVSGDRERDLEPGMRDQVGRRLSQIQAPDSWIQMVRGIIELNEADEKRIFGESLPPGLRLMT
jgi:hypothetical protein